MEGIPEWIILWNNPLTLIFAVNISTISVPNSIHEALRVPEWRAAVYEEVRALEKMGLGKCRNFQKGKILRVASGFSQ